MVILNEQMIMPREYYAWKHIYWYIEYIYWVKLLEGHGKQDLALYGTPDYNKKLGSD